ncbi:MAG: Hfq protein [Acidobacteria bacterium]|jgi:sRNA-binding regulator protein Hfq|nr:Hfq protein [Acidobacteriota bacterium]
MNSFHNRGFQRRRFDRHHFETPQPVEPVDMDVTGSEAEYLKSLIDSRALITVVLTSGERLRGRMRYYDRHCFSIGLAGGGPKIFLRKSNVRCIEEAEVKPRDD